MNIGDKVKINMPNTVWDGKEGVLESVNDNTCTVFVDFIPEQGKKVRQDFNIDNLRNEDYNITEELKSLKEDSTKGDNMEPKVIKEIDWNGNHYTFTNTYRNTGTKSHDVLTMEDQNGNSWTGETTWINRPWHRFDLEEAFTEIVSKAFGPKAVELLKGINEKAYSVEQAIEEFFAQFKPEDIQANAKDSFDDSAEARKQALANYLEVDVELIEDAGDNEFSYDGATYRVLTDSEADYEFDEAIRNLWDEVGFDGVGDWMHDWILENALDDGALEDLVRESVANDIEWLSDEEVADACIDEGIVSAEEVYDEESDEYNPELRDDVDFDDLREKLIDARFDAIDDYTEYVNDMGLDSDTLSYYIDDEKVIDALKDDADVNGSGRGQELAYYDGDELDLGNGLFAYRVD